MLSFCVAKYLLWLRPQLRKREILSPVSLVVQFLTLCNTKLELKTEKLISPWDYKRIYAF